MDGQVTQRLTKASVIVVITITVGTFGFWALEAGNASLWDCLYMTIITLSTVGYGEVIPMDTPMRVFASLLILFGMGSLIYFGSTVVALWVELDMGQVRRRKRMQKKIDNLRDHVIVCGVGTTGSHVVRELVSSRRAFVMVELREERMEEIRELTGGQDALFIHGDATEDRILHIAGVDKAKGLIAALPSDKDNLFIILSARQMNPALRIIARATEKDSSAKMIRAGADQVVSPNLIGGMRIASEMIRPQVVEFLDMMLRDTEQNVRIEQVLLPAGSPYVGKLIADANIRKVADVLVIALRDKEGRYTFNPGPGTELTADSTLVVLGSIDSVIELRRRFGGRGGDIALDTP